MKSRVPSVRIRSRNHHQVNPGGEYVVYWMIAARRSRFNFALERAADWARHLDVPLVVLEALRVGYPWASARLHRFVLDGMVDNAAAFDRREVSYLPYVEPEPGAGSGLLESLAEDAAIIVTDDFPTFFLPGMVDAAARRLSIPLESVDSNGLIPLAATDSEFATAYAFRRWIQNNLHTHLDAMPLEDPLAERLPRKAATPADVLERWPAVSRSLLDDDPGALAALPIDHHVRPAPTVGGEAAARQA
ncbi:MAG: deoxyribodipyrimidine photolyase, partial [Candidatus Sulfomarinibacteraceae bacterium]